jgi:quinohemoprotein amine dehydrogenase
VPSGFAKSHHSSSAGALAATLIIGFMVAAGAEAATVGPELLRTYCSGCHRESNGGFERISTIRKSPEGWAMTLFRMRQVHGMVLDGGVRDSIVRYLSDTQGLAPSEAAPGRFALERRPNARDLELSPQIKGMCGRCHSLARVALQRRDAAEWRKLSNTHVGQWPSIEYSASGRDRPWFQIATGPLPGELAALFPFSTPAWSEWQKRAAPDLRGAWVVVGHVPGGKDFYGTARIERGAAGDYEAHYQLTDVTGIAFGGDSKAILYTGYQWRGSAEMGERSLREVYTVSEDGKRIEGRWFDWVAVREDAAPQILAVLPRALRAGTTGSITIVGVGLGAKPLVSLGEGTTASNLDADAHAIRAQVKVAAEAAPGLRTVSAGGVSSVAAAGKFAVYRRIDRIDVVPGYAIARVGGGRIAPVSAQFEAIASTLLPDGEALELGPVAADWSSTPFDAEAKRTEDEKFAGHFERRGRFLPGAAGPNPEREMSGDNVGNLTVVARVQEGAAAVEGHGHLIVTVQRWNTPPIY